VENTVKQTELSAINKTFVEMKYWSLKMMVINCIL
jgi:hypothetical protein